MAVNLSSTTPAAPTGTTNVSFQTDGSGNVSGNIPTPAKLLTANNVDLTAQVANIAATNLLTGQTAGIYRVTGYIIVTQAATTSSTLPSIVITWTDQNSGQVMTLTLTPTNTGNTTTTYQTAISTLNVNTSAIQYSTTGYTSVGGTVMQYALHLRIEQM
jgi:hypothetical protein